VNIQASDPFRFRAIPHFIALALLLALGPLPTEIQGQDTPSTDIWAFRLTDLGERTVDVRVELNSAVRVTQRPGYDNQPHFPPGERLIFYTAIDSTGQADIWQYDLRTESRRNVTRSEPESEYSATVLPSLSRFSAIRVEADSSQRLWSFSSTGDDPSLVLKEIQPVGYHAWLSDDSLALFVLGTPATLQIASVREGTGQVVAEDIGRSIHRMPGRGDVSFVQWEEPGVGHITEYDLATGERRTIAPLLEGNEHYTWGPNGVLLMGQGSKLFQWILGISDAWREVADLSAAGIQGISRIAVSPEGGWIAVVAEEGG
jgi:hypothetical protein